ncbi:hypothetical protein KP79_PYT25309 [Mizuhopecten yessoensis]|uniref:Uncharacterized protein n=1 Tax=Mizuhopecten yessoensis TaxID=6573 RepID=A0A210PKZ1_MIZYE|nr:hypothetical protein KP79_PYT25309 [Mizuhopecten yessoensis]
MERKPLLSSARGSDTDVGYLGNSSNFNGDRGNDIEAIAVTVEKKERHIFLFQRSVTSSLLYYILYTGVLLCGRFAEGELSYRPPFFGYCPPVHSRVKSVGGASYGGDMPSLLVIGGGECTRGRHSVQVLSANTLKTQSGGAMGGDRKRTQRHGSFRPFPLK